MLVPIFKTILPKTLLKWTTPQSKLATKFKTKKTTATNTTTITENKLVKTTTTTLTLLCQIAVKTTAFETTLTGACHLALKSFASFFITIFIVARIFLNCVIDNLSSLMNDFRTKSRYLTTTSSATTSSSSNSTLFSSSSSTSSTTIDTKLLNSNYKNNHRTYNNSSKSNKVFLYYTPRDPRLRIFNSHQQPQKQQQRLATFNKHLVFASESELKITEDLCNYGELIGGGGSGDSGDKTKVYTNSNNKQCDSVILKNNNKNIISKNNYYNNSCTVNSCDFSSRVCDSNCEKILPTKSVKTYKFNCENIEKQLREKEKQKQQQKQQLKSFAHTPQNIWLIAIKRICIAGARF